MSTAPAPSPPVRLLGIDPGLRVTGFGIVDTVGASVRYVASGVIRTPAGTLAQRLGSIFDGLREVITEYNPQEAAVEIVFVNVNPKSTLLLGQARGAAITAAVSAGLDVHEYTALQIKQAVAGHGRAAKAQMQAMVQRLLSLPGLPSTDAADALGCAICHSSVRTSLPTIAAPVTALSGPGGTPRGRATVRGARLSRGRLR